MSCVCLCVCIFFFNKHDMRQGMPDVFVTSITICFYTDRAGSGGGSGTRGGEDDDTPAVAGRNLLSHTRSFIFKYDIYDHDMLQFKPTFLAKTSCSDKIAHEQQEQAGFFFWGGGIPAMAQRVVVLQCLFGDYVCTHRMFRPM